MSTTTPTPELTITTACAIVRADLYRTDVDIDRTADDLTEDQRAEIAQFDTDYGTDEDIQAHVLDWAYMFEEPTAEELAEDAAYAECMAAWKFIMENGVHPKA